MIENINKKVEEIKSTTVSNIDAKLDLLQKEEVKLQRRLQEIQIEKDRIERIKKLSYDVQKLEKELFHVIHPHDKYGKFNSCREECIFFSQFYDIF